MHWVNKEAEIQPALTHSNSDKGSQISGNAKKKAQIIVSYKAIQDNYPCVLLLPTLVTHAGWLVPFHNATPPRVHAVPKPTIH